jgi:non-heme chloroperoxidase
VEGIIQNWWRQGMMGGAKAHYEGVKAFSETDFTEADTINPDLLAFIQA